MTMHGDTYAIYAQIKAENHNRSKSLRATSFQAFHIANSDTTDRTMTCDGYVTGDSHPIWSTTPPFVCTCAPAEAPWVPITAPSRSPSRYIYTPHSPDITTIASLFSSV